MWTTDSQNTFFIAEVQEAGLLGSHGAGLKEHDSETTRPTAAAQFPP